MNLVSVKWLNDNLQRKDIVILDTSIVPITNKNNYPLYDFKMIKNARRFDLENVFSDTSSPFPHTFPRKEIFIKEMKNLGILNKNTIVLYDNKGIYSSPRVFYMLKSLGHQEVYVLNGGLPEWEKYKLPTEFYKKRFFSKGNFSPKSEKTYFCDIHKVYESLNKPSIKIIDARSEKRFLSLVEEPRPNVKLGHIPNSINIPFDSVLNQNIYKSTNELKHIFNKFIENKNEIIFYCGSGVTSCIPAFALELLKYTNFSIYDGSWSEWADINSSYPVENN